jgi:hypothetical protein
MVDKLKFGERHTCYACGCKFYDMHRNPPTCPKCHSDASRPPKEIEEIPFVPDVDEEPEEVIDELDEKNLEVDTEDDGLRAEDDGDD